MVKGGRKGSLKNETSKIIDGLQLEVLQVCSFK